MQAPCDQFTSSLFGCAIIMERVFFAIWRMCGIDIDLGSIELFALLCSSM
jgi:hypothetical protein